LDAHGLTLACATNAEERTARRTGLRTAVVGLAVANGVPDCPVVSYGLAGSLDGLGRGAVIDAVRVVDERGETLWTGEGLGVPGAVRGTLLAADRIVDDPAERARLYRETGALAVDMESGVLARRGELRGVLRAVADTPERPLRGIVEAVRSDGSYAWTGLVRAAVRSPRNFARAATDGRCALRALAHATRRWADG
jgi:adenosylhomocysteine nucleosidase